MQRVDGAVSTNKVDTDPKAATRQVKRIRSDALAQANESAMLEPVSSETADRTTQETEAREREGDLGAGRDTTALSETGRTHWRDVCWWAPRAVSLCWFPFPVFPPSEQQTCQAKQLGKASVMHMSFRQVQSRVV